MSVPQKALIITLVALDLICPILANKVMIEEVRNGYTVYLFCINVLWLAMIMGTDVFC